MASRQSRHERGLSEKAQVVPTGAQQRPGMGSRTSSAPVGQLHKTDLSRRPSAAARSGRTLVEEDEGSTGASFAARRPRSRHHADEVCLPVPIQICHCAKHSRSTLRC